MQPLFDNIGQCTQKAQVSLFVQIQTFFGRNPFLINNLFGYIPEPGLNICRPKYGLETLF